MFTSLMTTSCLLLLRQRHHGSGERGKLTAARLPEQADLVDNEAEEDGPGDRTYQPDDDRLDAEGQRSLF